MRIRHLTREQIRKEISTGKVLTECAGKYYMYNEGIELDTHEYVVFARWIEKPLNKEIVTIRDFTFETGKSEE